MLLTHSRGKIERSKKENLALWYTGQYPDQFRSNVQIQKRNFVTFCHLSFIIHLIARPLTKYLLSRIYICKWIYTRQSAPELHFPIAQVALWRGARQDWPSISIFPPPFYIKHQDFGAHWARKAQLGQVSPRGWIDRMACSRSVVVGHVKLPSIPNDLMMLTGRLYQDA